MYCDPKYTIGHKCGGQLYSLEVLPDTMVEMQEEEYVEDVTEEEQLLNAAVEQGIIDDFPQVSLNALSRTTTYHTIMVKGYVNKQAIHILMDSRSTHNFFGLANC